MTDCTSSGIPPDDEQLGHSDDRRGNADCGVGEEHFPCIGKCYCRADTPLGAVNKMLCRYCSVWTSLPCGEDLEVRSIFECSLYGYGKRIKE